jgi:hypothetical protein
MESNLPKVIYVTGLAYSGTTLFSSALGHSENVFNAGEVNYLENDYHNNKTCSCGHKVNDCIVWRPVLDLVNIEAKKHIKTLAFSEGQTLRAIDKRFLPLSTRILMLFGARLDKLFERNELKDYALRHQNFMRALSTTVNVDFVVDASKSFARLDTLLNYTDLAIHVIYVRRSIVQSYASRLKRAKRRNKFYVPLFAPVYLSVIFFREKDLSRRLKAIDSKNVSIVDYEVFVDNPQSIEAQLRKEIGIPIDFGIRKNEFNLDHLHVFTGNIWLPLAAKTKKKVTIKSSDGQDTLSWFEKQSFRVLLPIFKLFSD